MMFLTVIMIALLSTVLLLLLHPTLSHRVKEYTTDLSNITLKFHYSKLLLLQLMLSDFLWENSNILSFGMFRIQRLYWRNFSLKWNIIECCLVVMLEGLHVVVEVEVEVGVDEVSVGVSEEQNRGVWNDSKVEVEVEVSSSYSSIVSRVMKRVLSRVMKRVSLPGVSLHVSDLKVEMKCSSGGLCTVVQLEEVALNVVNITHVEGNVSVKNLGLCVRVESPVSSTVSPVICNVASIDTCTVSSVRNTNISCATHDVNIHVGKFNVSGDLLSGLHGMHECRSAVIVVLSKLLPPASLTHIPATHDPFQSLETFLDYKLKKQQGGDKDFIPCGTNTNDHVVDSNVVHRLLTNLKSRISVTTVVEQIALTTHCVGSYLHHYQHHHHQCSDSDSDSDTVGILLGLCGIHSTICVDPIELLCTASVSCSDVLTLDMSNKSTIVDTNRVVNDTPLDSDTNCNNSDGDCATPVFSARIRYAAHSVKSIMMIQEARDPGLGACEDGFYNCISAPFASPENNNSSQEDTCEFNIKVGNISVYCPLNLAVGALNFLTQWQSIVKSSLDRAAHFNHFLPNQPQCTMSMSPSVKLTVELSVLSLEMGVLSEGVMMATSIVRPCGSTSLPRSFAECVNAHAAVAVVVQGVTVSTEFPDNPDELKLNKTSDGRKWISLTVQEVGVFVHRHASCLSLFKDYVPDSRFSCQPVFVISDFSVKVSSLKPSSPRRKQSNSSANRSAHSFDALMSRIVQVSTGSLNFVELNKVLKSTLSAGFCEEPPASCYSDSLEFVDLSVVEISVSVVRLDITGEDICSLAKMGGVLQQATMPFIVDPTPCPGKIYNNRGVLAWCLLMCEVKQCTYKISNASIGSESVSEGFDDIQNRNSYVGGCMENVLCSICTVGDVITVVDVTVRAPSPCIGSVAASSCADGEVAEAPSSITIPLLEYHTTDSASESTHQNEKLLSFPILEVILPVALLPHSCVASLETPHIRSEEQDRQYSLLTFHEASSVDSSMLPHQVLNDGTNRGFGILFSSSVLSVVIKEVKVSLSNTLMSWFSDIALAYAQGERMSERFWNVHCFALLDQAPCGAALSPMNLPPDLCDAETSSSDLSGISCCSLLRCRLGKVTVVMSYNQEDVFFLLLKSLRVHLANYSIQRVIQLNGKVKDANLSDLTERNSWFKNILSSTQEDDHDTMFTMGHEKKEEMIAFHLTASNCLLFRPLLEVHLNSIRVTYLHRAVMTLVSYVFDHIMDEMDKYLVELEKGSLGRSSLGISYHEKLVAVDPHNLRDCENENGADTIGETSIFDSIFRTIHSSAAADSGTYDPGMYRIACTLRNAEVHLPINSCGDDAIVLLLGLVQVYRSDSKFDGMHERYLQGPLMNAISSQDGRRSSDNKTSFRAKDFVWLSDFEHNVNLCSSRATSFKEQSSKPFCQSKSKLATLFSPQDMGSTEVRNDLQLSIQLKQTSICSWCCSHLIAKDMEVSAKYNKQLVLPAPDGMYAPVGATLGFLPALPIGVHDIDVSIPQMDWCLSRGQYNALVFVLQQNLGEVQKVVPDGEYPASKSVPLTHEFHGKRVVEDRIPLSMALVLNVPHARVHLLENTTDYYTRLFYSHECKSGFLRHEDGVDVDRVLLDERQEYIDQWFENYSDEEVNKRRCSSILPQLPEDKVPLEGRRGSYEEITSRQRARAIVYEEDEAEGSEEVEDFLFVNGTVLNGFTIPHWSQHFELRTKILLGIDASTSSCGQERNNDENEDVDTDKSDEDGEKGGLGVPGLGGLDDVNEDNKHLDSIGFLFLTSLQFCFHQRHHGAATILDLTTDEIYVTAGSNKRVFPSTLLKYKSLTRVAAVFAEKDNSIRSRGSSIARLFQSSSTILEEDEPEERPNEVENVASGITAADPLDVFHSLDLIAPEFILLKQSCRSDVEAHVFHYKQTSVQNLRTCEAMFSHCVLVGHLPLLYDLQSFFQEVSYLAFMREIECLHAELRNQRTDSPHVPPNILAVLNFPSLMDVKVRFDDSIFAFPNYTYTSAQSILCPRDTKALCLKLTAFTYTVASRGYMEAGPGWYSTCYHLPIESTFISNLTELCQTQSIADMLFESIISPIEVTLKSDYTVLPPNEVAMKYYTSAQKSFAAPNPFRYEGNRDGMACCDNMMLLTINPLVLSSAGCFESSKTDALSSDDDNEDFTDKLRFQHEVGGDDDDIDSICGTENSVEDENFKSPSSDGNCGGIIILKLSLPDIVFLNSVCRALSTSSNAYVVRPLVQDIYSTLFSSFNDIIHLPRYTDYYESVAICGSDSADLAKTGYYAPIVKTTEIIVSMSSVQVLVRNNTYGIKIAKINIAEPRFSFNRSRGVINVAGSGELLVYLFNVKMGVYEAFVEKLRLTCICATDITSSLSESAMESLQNPSPLPDLRKSISTSSEAQSPVTVTPKLRFDIAFEPIEVNLCDSMMINLISKLALGDVITSSTANSPVYRAVNKLGLNVNCIFLFENYDYEHKCMELLESNEVFAIDTRQNNSSRNRRKGNGNPGKGNNGGKEDEDEESHTLSLAFTMAGQRYRSRQPIPIDKEGIYSVIMRADQYNFQAASPAPSRLKRGTHNNIIGESNIHLYDQRPHTSDVIVLMEMKIIDIEGTREVTLRSALSLKNETDNVVIFRADLLADSVSRELRPDDEWYLPVFMISQFTSLHMKLIASADSVVLADVDSISVGTGIMSQGILQRRDSRNIIPSPTSTNLSPVPSLLHDIKSASKERKLKKDEEVAPTKVTGDDRSGEWVVVYQSLFSFVSNSSSAWAAVGGSKAFAVNDYSHSQFKASMVTVVASPAERESLGDIAVDLDQDLTWDGDVDNGGDGKKINFGGDVQSCWSALMRPSPLLTHVAQRTGESDGLPTRRNFNVKYPSSGEYDASNQTANEARASMSKSSTHVEHRDDQLRSSVSNLDLEFATTKLPSMKFCIFPSLLSVCPPLQFLNQFCQPILYRIREGRKSNCTNSDEGTILPGNEIDLYLNPSKTLYLSIRMLNYKWSAWMKLSAFSGTLKEVTEQMSSLRLYHNEKFRKMRVPNITFSLIMHERSIRVCCSMWLINRLGLTLNYKEGGLLSTSNDYRSAPTFIPHQGSQRIENAMVKTLDTDDDAVAEKSDDEMDKEGENKHVLLSRSATRGGRRHSRTLSSNDVSEFPVVQPDVSAVSSKVDSSTLLPTIPSSTPPKYRPSIHRSVSEKVMSAGRSDGNYDGTGRLEDDVQSSVKLTFAQRKYILGSKMDFSSAIQSSHELASRRQLPTPGGPFPITPRMSVTSLFAATRPQSIDITVYSPFDRLKSFSIRMLSTNTVHQLREEVLKCVFGYGTHHFRTCRFRSQRGQSESQLGVSMIGGRETEGGDRSYATDDFYLFDIKVSDSVNKCAENKPSTTNVGSDTTLSSSSSPPKRRMTLFSLGKKKKDQENYRNTKPSYKGTTEEQSQEAEEREAKASVTYGMNISAFVKCGRESALALDSKLSDIDLPRNVLCVHVSELRILEQILASEDDEMKKSTMTKMFHKKNERIFPFSHFRGEIPFNPEGMLGIFPSFSFCVPGETVWSEAINVQKLDFNVTGAKFIHLSCGFSEKEKEREKENQDIISESRFMACGISGTGLHHPCEVALLVQRGEGLYKNVSAVTIVPKTMLSSKLPFALEIRQVRLDDNCNVVESSKPFMLLPGSIQQYHHPLSSSTAPTSSTSHVQIVQLCQASPMKTEENIPLSFEWSGEVDLTVIGVTNVKLQNPRKILNLRGETVGGTHVTTFSLQHANWPPYRIDNRTSFDIRVKQVRKSKNSKANFELCQYDYLPPFSSLPYSWDYCLNYSTEKRNLAIEFRQGKEWSSIDFPLNEVGHTEELGLKRDLPDLSFPVHEGQLECKYKSDKNKVQDWKNCICLAHDDVFYLFRNKSNKDLYAMVNLFVPKQHSSISPHVSSTEKQHLDDAMERAARMKSIIVDSSIEFATVEREIKKDWGISNLFTNTLGKSNSRIAKERIAAFYDELMYFNVNSLRRRLLIVGENLGLLDDACSQLRAIDSDDDSDDNFELDGNLEKDGPLVSSLKANIKIRELMNHLASKPVSLYAFASALQVTGDAPSSKHGQYLVEQFILRGYLLRGNRHEETPISRPAFPATIPTSFPQEESVEYVDDAQYFYDANDEYGDVDCDSPSTRPRLYAVESASHVNLRTSRLRATTTLQVPSQDLMSTNSVDPFRDTHHTHTLSASAALKQWVASLDFTDKYEQVYIVSPTLSEEMEKVSEVEGRGVKVKASGLDRIIQDCDFRFFIKIGGSVHRFRCSSEEDMWTWIISVRTCVENAWVQLVRKDQPTCRRDEDMSSVSELQVDLLTKESLNTSAKIGVRTEGPMKVVELDEEVISMAASSSSATKQHIKSKDKIETSVTKSVANVSQGMDVSAHSDSSMNSTVHNSGVSEELESVDMFDRVNDGRRVLDCATASQSSETGSNHRPLSRARNLEATASATNVSSGTADVYDNELSADTPLATEVFLSVFCPSIGFSIIEASSSDPAELLCLCFRDTQISYEQSEASNCISYALTVQHVQIDNQLLNPLYPVSFRPRSKVNVDTGAAFDSSQNGKGPTSSQFLMLPGLPTQYYQSQSNTNPTSYGNTDPSFRYPTIHCYCRQRPSVDKSTTTYEELVAEQEGGVDKKSNERTQSDLLYFELFTLWVAPLELSIDEETFVRVLRSAHLVMVAHQAKGRRIGVNGNGITYKGMTIAKVHAERRLLAKMRGENYNSLLLSGINNYEAYYMKHSLGKNIYIALLQLHPVDLVLSIRDTPDFSTVSKSEGGSSDIDYLTLAVRIDYGHIKLNALMANNVFGMSSFIVDILSKHYTNAVIRQVMPLVGSTDMIEGSVGLLTNLGTGVYDFFYEPIEGLLGDEQTFMEGLSRGGKSLAARTIGGTSAFTSKITGGLGKGMSMLTMDAKFQQRRNKERLKTAQSVSEGLKVGGKEFGRDIFDGVTGIVMEPYRGWKEDGGVGLGKGLAKGLLGVAFKPAVGVLDLTSRAAEGVRNAAFNTKLEAGYMNILGRLRLPRQFGRDGLILPYSYRKSMVQLIVDRLTMPSRKLRYYIYHSFCFQRSRVSLNNQSRKDADLPKKTRRKSIVRQGNMIINSTDDEQILSNTGSCDIDDCLGSHRRVGSMRIDNENDRGREIKGYTIGDDFFVTISSDKIMLFCVNLYMHGSSCKFNSSRNASGNCLTELHHATQEVANVKLVWSCPTLCVGEFSSDSRGDVVLSVAQSSPPVQSLGHWYNPKHPTLHDPVVMDYYSFQEHLEGCMGAGLAQLHPLHPDVSENDCLCVEISRKRTGMHSILQSYTTHQYRIYKYVLYEFSEVCVSSRYDKKTGSDKSKEGDQVVHELGDPSDIHSDTSPDILYSKNSSVGQFLHRTYPPSSIYQRPSSVLKSQTKGSDRTDDDDYAHEEANEAYVNRSRNMLLTLAVPLINIRVLGPDLEDQNRYSIKICHKTASSKLSLLVRGEPSITSRLAPQSRDTLTLVFPDRETAQVWKVFIAETAAGIGTKGMHSIVHPAGFVVPSIQNIRRTLVLPVGGTDLRKAEQLKVEIAKNLTLMRMARAEE